MLQSYEPDDCCGEHLADALLSGKLDEQDRWVCPECGEVWIPQLVFGVRHWIPVPVVEVWR